VEVIATEGSGNDNVPVLVRKGKTLAATFHPELSEDPRIHKYFLDMVSNGKQKTESVVQTPADQCCQADQTASQ
jgi:hypothetical protein